MFASDLSNARSETLDRPPTGSADTTPIQIRPGDTEPANSESLQPGEDNVPDPVSDVPEPKASETFEKGLTPSQLHDLRNSSQSHRFKDLSPEERSMLIRAHKNLGHPSPERLSTMLRSQGYRAEIAKAALELKCSVCKSQAQPRLARPGTIKDELDFNDRICIDGLQWTNRHEQNFHVYHIVDWATSFQTACCAPDRTTNAAIQGMFQMWFSWAGAPSEMIVDAATEFNSEEFQHFSQSHNIKVTTISVEAQFQNGKAERHGSILKSMLSKYEAEHAINNYKELQEALWWCTQAKNSCGLRKGYAPEVLVLGKHTRIPGAVSSDELLPAHLLADSETSQGVQFRKQLAMRECARRAFHHADNDAALRRSILRRDRPGTSAYSPGEWVMIWRTGKGGYPGGWTGPMKIVVQENAQTIWSTGASKLFRSAPEHVRPVTASEARDIPITHQGPPVAVIAKQIPWNSQQGLTRAFDLTSEITHHQPSMTPQPPQNNIIPNPSPLNNNNPENTENQSEGQPDGEPEAPQSQPSVSQAGEPADGESAEIDNQINDPAVTTPVPDDDDDLVCDSLICCDEDPCCVTEAIDLAWRFEVDIRQQDLDDWRQETNCSDMAFVASAAKRQRSEVKISTLSPSEKAEFQKAKNTEINNWIKTGTISKILREKIPREQVLRCRWILTWKPVDEEHQDKMNAKDPKRVKAKARLVILGYMDPQLEDLPRDSPTLGRNSKMILLQLIASMGWDLKSFDIKAAFLQGKPQPGRTLAVEPVPELFQALNMTPEEVCKLEKGAYGLVDAPYLWFLAISEELQKLGFVQSPFDPCLYVLHRNGNLEGILGLHVDDGICGGSKFFQEKINQLEAKYPFGSKKIRNFTFTGIEMQQLPNHSIHMSQAKYVRAISPIHIKLDRRKQSESPVTEEERQELRALIGSLQYGAVHTRPDLASRLSNLQSAINRATVETLISANQALHEAKKYSEVTIKIQPIPIKDFRFLAFSDASFASKSNPSSHTGMLIMGTHKEIGKNVTCPVSPLAWGCKKIQRVVTSTLAAETVSLNTVLDQLSWMRLCWGWLLDPTIKWKQPSKTLKELPETFSTATFNAQNIPESITATDCKSLYDLVTRTAMPNCAEYRAQLNARSIKDYLSEGVTLRWVHSGAQLADSLTKIMENGFLRETLSLGQYKLHDELEVLKDRATTRNRIRWLRGAQVPLEGPTNCSES